MYFTTMLPIPSWYEGQERTIYFSFHVSNIQRNIILRTCLSYVSFPYPNLRYWPKTVYFFKGTIFNALAVGEFRSLFSQHMKCITRQLTWNCLNLVVRFGGPILWCFYLLKAFDGQATCASFRHFVNTIVTGSFSLQDLRFTLFGISCQFHIHWCRHCCLVAWSPQ